MTALRDRSAFNSDPVLAVLKKFAIPEATSRSISIIKAERLTPDSSAIVLLAQGATYVLYVEDFIDKLAYIEENIKSFYPSNTVSFMSPKESVDFKQTSGSRYYMQPDLEKIDEWMKFAVPVGGDYAFLGLVEPAEENESYWAKRLEDTEQPSPEIEALIKKHMPYEPGKPFIDEWLEKK